MANNITTNIDPELIQTFIQEFTVILQQVNETVHSLEMQSVANPDQIANAINALFRGVHTIKSSLQIVNLTDLAVTVHNLEDQLAQIRIDNTKYTPELGKMIYTTLDGILCTAKLRLNVDTELTSPSQPKKSLMHIIMAINRETGMLFSQSWVDEFNVAIKQLYQARNGKKPE